MKRIRQQMKAQLGWQGTAGVFLLALAGAFNYLALQPLEQQTEFIHERIDHARFSTDGRSKSYGFGGRQQELASFFESLPDESEVTDILAKIYLVGESSGVSLKQAEYKIESPGNSYEEYSMSFPVKGGYVNIRAFIARILADHPALALNAINFHRDKIDDSSLSADIRLTLFLKR